jgi:hypothetical protein
MNRDGTIYASVVFRCPLSGLASPSGGTLSCTNFWQTGVNTFTPVDGATTTMYWADHADNATLQVFSWPESVDWPSVTWTYVAHAAFPYSGYSCSSPDGSNMCGADDWTIRGGWLTGGVLGFIWDAAQGNGGLGTFPYPYVHVVELNEADMTLIDQPIIWSSANAWAYGAVAVNGQGELGVTAAYSGGGSYPGSAVMMRDSVSPSAWQPLNAQEGLNGPPGNRWGDYLTVHPYAGNGTTWVAATYTLQGTCPDNWGSCSSVQPRLLWFGRESNDPQCHPVGQNSPSSTNPSSKPPSAHRIYLPIVVNGGCLA